MTRFLQFFFILLLGLGIGFWAGQLKTVNFKLIDRSANEKKPLYYRHPMNPQVTSPTPAKDEIGMDYVPVYAEDPNASPPSSGDKILYYRHPMGAADTSPVPKKDEMGMDYLPVYQEQVSASSQLQLSPEKIQKLGVTTATVTKRALIRRIRALGTIQIDERRVQVVAPKVEGWIQQLYVNATGQAVKKGQALLEIYSPDFLAAQQDYLIARKGQEAMQKASPQARENAAQLLANTLQRLRYWDIDPLTLKLLKQRDQALPTLPLLAPMTGVVIEKPAQQGMRFMPGELLFRIADLNQVWLLADVFEQDLSFLSLGQAVQVDISAFPERLFAGKVSFIYPNLSQETRTVKVRIELPNQNGLLKPGLYASVTLATEAKKSATLAAPESAIIDTGARQIALLKRSEGRFEARTVKLGALAEGYYEILKGLSEGDQVVTHANFLIDAESKLKSALENFSSLADEPAQTPAGSANAEQGVH